MKKLFFLGIILSFLTVYMNADNPQSLPPGPYLTNNQCQGCYIVNNAAGAELHCSCHKYRDEWKINILPNARACQYPYELINENGKLKCALHTGMDYCKRCYIFGDTASCKLCQDGIAEQMPMSQAITKEPASGCRYQVINNVAQQVCDVPPIPK